MTMHEGAAQLMSGHYPSKKRSDGADHLIEL